jgi:hypothetical protein
MQFEYVITGDEFWFYSYNRPDAAWAASRDELPERIEGKIDTEKCLISVLWSLNGIHHLIDVPRGMKYDSSSFCDAVMPGFIQKSTSNTRPPNCRQSQECIQASKAKRLPHPVDSPDLAPSDFFLFGYLKENLTVFHCTTRDELKSAIITIVNGIDGETLLAVFDSWFERLD